MAAGALLGTGKGREERGSALHAPGTAGPVAVVEVEAFTLQDECADAVLYLERGLISDGRGEAFAAEGEGHSRDQ